MKNRTVAIISRESNSRTLDIQLLEEELVRRGLRVITLCRLLTKDKSVRMLGYAGHILKQLWAIASSGVVVLDTYCIPVSMLPRHRGTKVLQMWHAIAAVKKFGWQTVGRKDGSSERIAHLMRMHRGYDHVACASDITAEHFCEAFRVGSDSIVKLGLPRIDYIRRVTGGEGREEALNRIYDRYPQLKEGKEAGRRLVLYAPTFHRGRQADAEGLARALPSDRWDIVVKLHPIDREGCGQPEGRSIIYDEEFLSYDWLAAADAVISDYSSFVVEATLADKPLYLYTFDIDEYSMTTGLNIDFDSEPIAPVVFRTAGELASAMEEPYDLDALRRFRDRYIDIAADSCTARLADFIENLLREESRPTDR